GRLWGAGHRTPLYHLSSSLRAVVQVNHRAPCAFPAPAHSMLLEFNLRWNLRMMVKKRGLPAALGGHCNKYLGKLIQRATGTGSRVAPSPRSGQPPSTQ
ncbi:unnamed protein product, partial [Ectocarpus sp. 4 AP-2014]